MSLNVVPPDPSINALVPSSAPLTDSDLLKSASAFSTWDGTAWRGSLATWNAEQTHLLKMASPASFSTSGMLVEKVDVNVGWNWIAMASHSDIPIDAVTHSAGFQDGDLLKSASAFSTYTGSEFRGGLSTMEVGNGYLLKCARPGTLRFGTASHRRLAETSEAASAKSTHAWASQANLGDTTASLDVTVSIDDLPVTTGTLGAFNSKGAVLGVASTSFDRVYSLSVTNPRFVDRSVSDVVTFRFDTGSRIVDLATTYAYEPHAHVLLHVTDAQPARPSLFKWRRQ